MQKVSIIIPVIRPEKAKRCIEAIGNHAGYASDYYEIIFLEDTDRIGCPKMVEKLVAQTKYDLVCFLGDDVIPKNFFLYNALKAMAAIPDGWGMVSFNDNPTTTRSAAHWLSHKKLLPELGGQFFHTGYKHCFCDDELLVRCQLMNRYIYAYDAVLEHDHFSIRGEDPDDDDMKRVYAQEQYEIDHQLFLARSNNNWETPKPSKDVPKNPRVVVAVPSNDMIYAAFSMDLVQMVCYSMQKGVQLSVLNQNSSIIEAGRAAMAGGSKELGADYLLSIDSDMRFPKDLLLRLLQWNKDVVCCDAIRRREPFTQVVEDMNFNPIDYKSSTLKPLVELSGGSSAIQLVKTSVFNKLKHPYYLVEWKKDKGYIGEDYYFTRKIKAAGMKVFCDTALSKEITHLGVKEYKIGGVI